MEFPKRKVNRLTEYDYSLPGAYFITVCTNERNNLFWRNFRVKIDRPQDVQLSQLGLIVDRAIKGISEHYPGICVDHYVIMPNHVHLLLQICTDDNGRPVVAPTISTVIQQMKGTVTKQSGIPVWQKGFHDHVIRGEADYREIWTYIESNPMKWTEDSLFVG